MESADVVIAGGGIMGCALAYQLSQRKVDVLLVERETLGSQSTGKCAGGVRQQFSSEGNVRLQKMSVGMLERFDEEIGTPRTFASSVTYSSSRSRSRLRTSATTWRCGTASD